MVRSTGILEPIPTATSNTAPKKRNWTLSEDALLTNLMQSKSLPEHLNEAFPRSKSRLLTIPHRLHRISVSDHRRSSDKSGSKSGQTDWVGIAQHFDDRDSKDVSSSCGMDAHPNVPKLERVLLTISQRSRSSLPLGCVCVCATTTVPKAVEQQPLSAHLSRQLDGGGRRASASGHADPHGKVGQDRQARR